MASKNMDTLTAETAQALTKERKDVAFVIAYTHEPEGMSPPDHATPYHGEREVDTAKGWPEAQTLFRGIALDNKTLHAELKLVIRSLHGPTINEAYVPYPCTTVSLATYRRGDPLPTVGDMAVDITWFDNTEETEMSWNEKGPECVTKGLAFFALKSRDPTVRKARCMLLLTHGGRQETLPLAGFDAEWTRMIGADTLESLGSLKRPRDSKEEEEDDWAEQPLVKRPCRRQAPLWNPDQEPEEIHVYGTQLMAVYGGDKKICNDIVLHMNAKSRVRSEGTYR